MRSSEGQLFPGKKKEKKMVKSREFINIFLFIVRLLN